MSVSLLIQESFIEYLISESQIMTECVKVVLYVCTEYISLST